jgi:hypothetical protein
MADECAVRARDQLLRAGLIDSQLSRIADWVVHRRS